MRQSPEDSDGRKTAAASLAQGGAIPAAELGPGSGFVWLPVPAYGIGGCQYLRDDGMVRGRVSLPNWDTTNPVPLQNPVHRTGPSPQARNTQGTGWLSGGSRLSTGPDGTLKICPCPGGISSQVPFLTAVPGGARRWAGRKREAIAPFLVSRSSALHLSSTSLEGSLRCCPGLPVSPEVPLPPPSRSLGGGRQAQGRLCQSGCVTDTWRSLTRLILKF